MSPTTARRVVAGLSSLALGFLCILAISCASSSGSGYRSSAGGDASAAQRAAAAKAAAPQRPTPPAHPSGPDSETGSEDGGGLNIFNIFLSSPGEAAPESVGYLVVEGAGSEAELFVDGDMQGGGLLTLSSGQHRLELRRFGYLDYRSDITIAEGATLRLRVNLVPAAFSIEELDLRHGSFDPADPGYLGECLLTIVATAPGRAGLGIFDSQGRLIRSFSDIDIAERRTSLGWDGRDEAGRIVAPGSYTIRAETAGGSEGAPPSGEASSATTVEARIEGGRYERSTTFYSGVSGALLAPDARTLAGGEVEAGAEALGHLELLGSSIFGRGTLDAGFRFGIPAAAGGMELGFSVLTSLYPGSMVSPAPDSWTATGAFKYGFVQGPSGGMAAYLKLSLASFADEVSSGWPPSWDGPTRYAGLSAGLPFELSSGAARLFVTPEIETSTFYPGYDDARWTVPGFFVWGYLRAGLELTVDRVSLAISAALRSQPFTAEPLMQRPPLAFGAELRWHSAASPFMLSLLATGEYWNRDNYYLSAGFGAGFRF